MSRMPIPQWRRSLLLAAALGVALPASGCAPTTGTGSPSPGSSASLATATPSAPASTATPTAAPTPTAPPPSASPAATSSPRAVAARVTVQRTGGLAGVTQKIVVESDGRWRYSEDAGTAQTGRLSAAQVKRLHLLLGDPSFGSAFYPGSCADGFHYSLLTGQRRVEWDDCGRSSPAEVAEAIVALLTDDTPF